MIIEFGGVTYDYDPARIDVRTAMVIYEHTKMGMLSWAKGVDDANPLALQGILYAMKVQNGERPAIKNLNFYPAELYGAIADAAQREVVEAVMAAEAALTEPEWQPADPTVTAEP